MTNVQIVKIFYTLQKKKKNINNILLTGAI